MWWDECWRGHAHVHAHACTQDLATWALNPRVRDVLASAARALRSGRLSEEALAAALAAALQAQQGHARAEASVAWPPARGAPVHDRACCKPSSGCACMLTVYRRTACMEQWGMHSLRLHCTHDDARTC